MLLFVCFITVTILSAFFNKAFLEFALPITFLVLIIDYYHKSKNVNTFFVISLISLIASDYFAYTDMNSNFEMVCIATSTYLIASCFALKDYFSQLKVHWIKLLSLPLLISLALVIFLIISISDIVLFSLPESTPYIIITIIPLLIYLSISYYIYMADIYNSGIKVLLSAIISVLVIALSPINELFYSSSVFTVGITTAYIGGIYMFMQFITETAPVSNSIPEMPKYI